MAPTGSSENTTGKQALIPGKFKSGMKQSKLAMQLSHNLKVEVEKHSNSESGKNAVRNADMKTYYCTGGTQWERRIKFPLFFKFCNLGEIGI